jgi:dipeptidyl aminopeptidase/acylaminoacyl peptidase
MAEPIKPEDFALYSFLSEPSVSPDGRSVLISVSRASLRKDQYDSDIWLMDSAGGKPKRLTATGKDGSPKFSPDGSKVLFSSRRGMKKKDKGNGLYVMKASGGAARLLIRRNQTMESLTWFPDGNRVLFISAEGKAQDDVKTIGRINFWFNEKGFIHNLRRHVFVMGVDAKEAVQLTKGEMDVDKAAISHSGRKIAYIASTEDARPYISDLFVYDMKSGLSTKVTRHDMELSAVTWSPDDGRLVLLGHRRGRGTVTHEHLWLVSMSDRKLTQLDNIDRSKVNTLNSDVRKGGLNPEPKWAGEDIYFLVNDRGAVHLYRIDSASRESKLVIGGDRSVEAFSIAKRRVFFTSMEAASPAELYLLDGSLKQLSRFNGGVKKDRRLRKPERFRFKASDGEAIDGWVLRPATKGKVPTILYIHGGPKTAFGSAYVHEFQVYAARGYAVLYVNPRGSDSYSEAFADIRGHYAERDYQDLMEAVDYAISRYGFIDSKRLGVAGGSYGGYMTNWMVTHTDRFKAAVTDRSISNWWTFWGTSDIGPYFMKDQIGCDPWDDEETTMAKSPIRYVKNVKTPLLIIHSMEDYRCWMVEALQFFTALKYYGKEVELILFPGDNHELSRGGKPKHRLLRLENYLRWFDTHLR